MKQGSPRHMKSRPEKNWPPLNPTSVPKVGGTIGGVVNSNSRTCPGGRAKGLELAVTSQPPGTAFWVLILGKVSCIPLTK
jgi:hypothetical protein